MEEPKVKRKNDIALKEYAFAEKLRESYFKNSWVATSIILPISFGLVGLSYQQPLLYLCSVQLLPLALTSIFLFIFWFWYVRRYAKYLEVIYSRFWDLEDELHMNLHRKIHAKGPKEWWSLGYLNAITGTALGIAWILRLLSA